MPAPRSKSDGTHTHCAHTRHSRTHAATVAAASACMTRLDVASSRPGRRRAHGPGNRMGLALGPMPSPSLTQGTQLHFRHAYLICSLSSNHPLHNHRHPAGGPEDPCGCNHIPCLPPWTPLYIASRSYPREKVCDAGHGCECVRVCVCAL